MTTFEILTVCTGNICRSPLAEQLLRAQTSSIPDVAVRSAGTSAMVGYGMDVRAANYSVQFGADPSSHVARQLVIDQVRSAGLVLAMSREHRKAVVELLPRASRYTFTVRELARVCEAMTEADLAEIVAIPVADPAARLAALVEAAAGLRGMVDPPASPDENDVVDPYAQSDEVYALSVDQLLPAVRTVASALQQASIATAI